FLEAFEHLAMHPVGHTDDHLTRLQCLAVRLQHHHGAAARLLPAAGHAVAAATEAGAAEAATAAESTATAALRHALADLLHLLGRGRLATVEAAGEPSTLETATLAT